MKAMKPTPAYVPDGLVKPTYDDLKNHGTAENITKKLREQLPNEFEYHREFYFGRAGVSSSARSW